MTGGPDPELDDELLDALLSREPLPPGAPDRARATAEMLASMTGPAGAGELAGEDAARAAFICGAHRSGAPAAPQHARRRAFRLPARVSLRLAAALAALAMLLGGTVAAYAGVLPDPVQQLAHATIGAPAPRHPRGHVTRHRTARRPASPAPTAGARGQPPGKGKGSEKANGKAKGHHKAGKAKGHHKGAKHKKAGKAKGDKKPKKAHKVKKSKKNHGARGRAAAAEV